MIVGRVSILDVDPDLGAALEHGHFEAARARCTAGVITPVRGEWPPLRPGGDASDDFGYLVLRGAVLQRVRVAGRETVDLFGPGDVVRPWGPLEDFGELLNPSRWQILSSVELAVLDRYFIERAAQWPEIVAALAGRNARHVCSLLNRLAISQIPRVETRLRIVLWDLADRFGRVSPEGVVLPLRLRHDVLAALVSASREAVSRSIGALQRAGLVARQDCGWLLLEGPPPDVFAVEAQSRSVEVGRSDL